MTSRLPLFFALLLILPGCGMSFTMVRGDYDVLREKIHRAKSQGAMQCSPEALGQAQVHYRYASLEMGQGDFDRASQHLVDGGRSVQKALTDSANCPQSGVSTKDIRVDPWADADGDGVGDLGDQCPYNIEDRDGFADHDGCSEPDNDLDGVLDESDDCPLEPEDVDGVDDEDGCPEVDDDADGVHDDQDRCPAEAETLNGYMDEDGCPDRRPKHLSIGPGGIEFVTPPTFLGSGAEIFGSTQEALEELAMLLKTFPDLRLSVAVHTSNRGEPDKLIERSQLRAESVLAFLVREGIEAGRLEATGFGGAEPIATNRTSRGRKANERIELRVLEGSLEELQ
ncbi:MAG: OmpA family protein [Myxococcota bacterium]|nr:OmpA family protein [Myxococcota bacterium]